MHHSWTQIFSKALTRPFALFAHEPIVQLLGLYLAFIYGLYYCAFLPPGMDISIVSPQFLV